MLVAVLTQLKYWRGPNSRRKDAHTGTHNTTHTAHTTHTTHVLLPALTRIVLLPALGRTIIESGQVLLPALGRTILKSGRVLLPALGQMSDHAATRTTEIGWTLSITDAVGHIRS